TNEQKPIATINRNVLITVKFNLVFNLIIWVSKAEFIQYKVRVIVPWISVNHHQSTSLVEHDSQIILFTNLVNRVPDLILNRFNQFLFFQKEQPVKAEYFLLVFL